jgi:hypothetical protein
MIDMVLSALVRAWVTTLTATTLFVAAVALSQVWDSATFLRSLQQALRFDM